MSENTTKQNLGNISSNLKHIVGFLTNRNWLILVPRIKKFIENTKQIYDQTNVDKNQIIFKKFEELLAKNIDQKLDRKSVV